MTPTGRNLRYLALLPLAALFLTHGATPDTAGQLDMDGDASAGIAQAPPNPGIQAAFTRRSYAPGTT